MLRSTTDRARPGLVALYDIRPGNGAGQFLQPRSPRGASKVKEVLKGWHRDNEHMEGFNAQTLNDHCIAISIRYQATYKVERDCSAPRLRDMQNGSFPVTEINSHGT